MAGAASTPVGREVVAELVSYLRTNTQARNDFILGMASGMQNPAGSESLRNLTLEMNRTPDSRDAVLRTLAQATTSEAGRDCLTTFLKALSANPEVRDPMLLLLNSAVTGDRHRKTVSLLVQNLEKSPTMQAVFLETVRQALETPKARIELKNLAAFLKIPLPGAAPAAPAVLLINPAAVSARVAAAATLAAAAPESPTKAMANAERVAASGVLGELNRDLKRTRRTTLERIEEIRLEAHKRTSFEARDLFPASAFTAFRKCSHCGFQSKADLGTCPHCHGESRQAVMQTEISYNLSGDFYLPLRDLVEFSPRAFKMMAEGLLGADKLVFLRYKQMIPNFKQLLEVVYAYR
jgi:hypothetical protein